MSVTPAHPIDTAGQLKINQKLENCKILNHSLSRHREERSAEMPVSAGFDEYQQYSDILSFYPSALERFSENVMKEKNSSAGEVSRLIVSPEQQNNNKRKSYHQAQPVKRQRVQPLELRETQAGTFSAYSAFCSSSLSLTPKPQNPNSTYN